MQGPGGLVYLGVLVVAFYLLIIRPQMQRNKQTRELMASLAEGDEIITIGGLHGTVTAIEGTAVTVRAADGVELVFEKSAIGRRNEAPSDVSDAGGADSDGVPDEPVEPSESE